MIKFKIELLKEWVAKWRSRYNPTDTLAEHFMKKGCCPDCGSEEMYEGPSGGMCTNVTCANPECGSKFNLGLPIMADRIGKPMPLKK